MPVLFPLFVYDYPVHKRAYDFGRQFFNAAVLLHQTQKIEYFVFLFFVLLDFRFRCLRFLFQFRLFGFVGVAQFQLHLFRQFSRYFVLVKALNDFIQRLYTFFRSREFPQVFLYFLFHLALGTFLLNLQKLFLCRLREPQRPSQIV